MRAVVLSVIVQCGVLAVGNAQAAAPPATLSIDDLVKGMSIIHDAFDPSKGSYRIRFRQEQQNLDEKGHVRPHANAWIENDYGRKGKLVYAHIKQKSPLDENPLEDWVVWDGVISVHRREDALGVYPYCLPQAYNCFRYTDGVYADCYRLIEWKLPSRLRRLGGNPSASNVFLLPRMIIENQRKYRLLPDQQKVDGDWCHVVEWRDRDRIWIDTNHGFVVRRRKMWFKKDVPAGEQFNRDLFEAKPGLWLPKNQEEQRYFHLHSPAHLIGKISRISKTELLHLSFRPLDDGFFELDIDDRERLLIHDNVRKMEYWRHPKGTDPVAAAIQDARSIRISGEMRGPAVWLLINGIVIGMLTLVWFVRRARAG